MNTSDTLEAYRPTAGGIQRTWGTAQRTATMAAVLEAAARQSKDGLTPPHQNPVRRRWVALAGAAALVAGTVTGAQLFWPTTTTSAAAVERLANTARSAPPLVIPEGQFLYLVLTTTPQPTAANSTPEDGVSSRSWTAEDGTSWRVDEQTVAGETTRSTMRFDPIPRLGGSLQLTPQGLKEWPTNPADLDPWIRERVSFDTDESPADQDRDVASVLHDALLEPTAPPALRSAAIQLLASLPGSTATSARGVTEISFPDSGNPGTTHTMTFDDASSRVLADLTDSRGAVVVTHMDGNRLVAAVPKTVLDAAVPQGNGDNATAQ